MKKYQYAYLFLATASSPGASPFAGDISVAFVADGSAQFLHSYGRGNVARFNILGEQGWLITFPGELFGRRDIGGVDYPAWMRAARNADRQTVADLGLTLSDTWSYQRFAMCREVVHAE